MSEQLIFTYIHVCVYTHSYIRTHIPHTYSTRLLQTNVMFIHVLCGCTCHSLVISKVHTPPPLPHFFSPCSVDYSKFLQPLRPSNEVYRTGNNLTYLLSHRQGNRLNGGVIPPLTAPQWGIPGAAAILREKASCRATHHCMCSDVYTFSTVLRNH